MNSLAVKRRWIITNKSPTNVMKDIVSQPGQEDPFFILDTGELVHQVQYWQELMPRVKIFYAVKCNDHEAVLETLVTLGTGFDCASQAEIQKVMDLGVKPSRIIYAHPCKSASDIEFASKRKVACMTFDCPEELQKVKTNYPDAELVIRLRCDALASTYTFGEKYGATLEDAFMLLSLARDLDLKVVGVSFHVGSGCEEADVYARAIAAAKQVFMEAERIGMNLHLLDIGGGFPGNLSHVFEGFASVINFALDKYFPESDDKLKIIAEPGRYIVTRAFSLATKIIATKAMTDDDRRMTYMYYVNDGVYGSFSTNLFENEPFTPEVLKNQGTEECGNEEDVVFDNSIIWGPTCCGLDVLKRAVRLPRLQCDDWLHWNDMGAYTITNASPFNGFPKPSVRVMASTTIL